jgi:hypothetical protein
MSGSDVTWLVSLPDEMVATITKRAKRARMLRDEYAGQIVVETLAKSSYHVLRWHPPEPSFRLEAERDIRVTIPRVEWSPLLDFAKRLPSKVGRACGLLLAFHLQGSKRLAA